MDSEDILFIIIIVAILIVSAYNLIHFVDNSSDKNTINEDTDWDVGGHVDLIINKDAGTVCYVFDDSFDVSISCLPLDETNISIGESQN